MASTGISLAGNPRTKRVPGSVPLLAFAVATVALAQAPQQAGVKESVQVRAAEIDVLVLDSKGSPVLDLRPEDFRLTVDGVARKIDWVLPPGSPMQRPAELESAVQVISAGSPSTEARGHSTVFFVDDLQLDRRSRYVGLHALQAYLHMLPAQEEVAVYSFQHRLQIAQRFTTDHKAIEGVLSHIGKSIPVATLLSDQAEWAAVSRDALQGLALMLRSIAGRPETKTIILLAHYLPMSSLTLPNPLNQVPFDFTKLIQEASADSYLARATVLALDPSGVPPLNREFQRRSVSRAPSPESATSTTVSGSASSSRSAAVRPSDPMDSGGDAFAVLANNTGGSRLTLSNQPERLLESETDLLNHRYRIGFTPQGESSQTRAVVVAVDRPGLSIRTPVGQRSLSGEALVHARFASSLLGAKYAPGDFPVQVANRGTSRHEGSKILSLEVRVPMREVFLQQGTDRLDGRVEVLAAAADDRGGFSDVKSGSVEIHVANADAARIPTTYFKTPLFLQIQGKGTILVGVRDIATNREGQASVTY